MTIRNDELSLRRVLVALEAGIPPQDILETAAELAACLEASLMGLLIEDEFLHSLAELPIAREVALGAADLRSLTRSDVASHYALQAQRIRRDLEAIAQRRRLECQFQVQRGLGSRLGELATRQDLLAMALPFGKLYRPTGQEMFKSFLQSKARALLALPARPQTLPPKSSPLVMLGDPGHADLLALARRIARQWKSSLHLISTVVKVTDDETSPQGGIVYHRLYKGEEPSQAIRRTVRRAGLILLPDLLAEESLRSLASLETPLLILRQDRLDR
jgi:hypothetical protein